jgi:hypothetical protein
VGAREIPVEKYIVKLTEAERTRLPSGAGQVGRQVPEFQRGVIAAGKGGAAIWGQGDRVVVDRVGMPREGAQLQACGQVPEFQRLVFAAGEGGAAIRGEGDRADPVGMPREGADRQTKYAPPNRRTGCCRRRSGSA